MAKHMEKMKLDEVRDEKMRQQIRTTRSVRHLTFASVGQLRMCYVFQLRAA